MLLFPATEADLVSLIDSAQRAVLVQNGSISFAPFLESLVRARKRGAEVKVLLGAKPSYSIVSGKVLIGNRPYDLIVGKALATFSAADIPVPINPRFNELAGEQMQEGVESHASYLSIDGTKSLVCTGAWSADAFKTQTNACVVLINGDDARARGALFLSEFNDTWSTERRTQYDAVARRRFVVSLGGTQRLVDKVQQADGVDVLCGGLGDSVLTQAIGEKGAVVRLVLPEQYRGQSSAVAALRSRGVRIRYADVVADGLVMVLKGSKADTNPAAFVGSQRLTANSMEKSREVGVFLSGPTAPGRAAGV